MSVAALLFCICAVILLGKMLEPDLSHPASISDRLDITDLGYVNVGEPLFELNAPLENYIPIYSFKWGSGTIYYWVNERAASEYWLPLYSHDGTLLRTLYLVRVSDDVFRATESSPELVSVFFEMYLSAKEKLINECSLKGVAINSFRLMKHEGGDILLANTSEGILGVLYNQTPVGMMVLPFYTPPDYGFSENTDRVLTEQELREILGKHGS